MVYFIQFVLALLATEGFMKFSKIKREDGMLYYTIQYILSSTVIWLLLGLLEGCIQG